jgi:biotin carboxyl carrier protein
MKYKVIIDNQTYEVNIEDIQARPVIALVEGERYEVWPEEARQLESVTPTSQPVSVQQPTRETTVTQPKPSGASDKAVSAPLPGVIYAVLVKPGDAVTRGQELCTLEAMKMKNAIRSTRDGTVASVEVDVGDQVGHGQVLMTFSN